MNADSPVARAAPIAPVVLPRALGGALGPAVMRARPEDFQVHELLGFEPAGHGEHVLLQLRKRNLTTRDVARRVAQAVDARMRDVGYCGMKDRNALTTQWFSVLLSGRPEPDWHSLEAADLALVRQVRHSRKLRPGSHSGNRFVLILTEVAGPEALFEQRLREIQRCGFPNYFGAQRFGADGGNVAQARAMLAGERRVRRGERGILLSALRSALFNRVLAQRVADGTWQEPLPEGVLMLAGTHSVFAATAGDDGLAGRLASGDVHVTGPMCGIARDSLGELHTSEQAILAPFAEDLRALQAAGVKAQRRALRAMPADFSWRWPQPHSLELTFTLEPGVFATSLVRELIDD